jgi:hypothetical protein
MPSDPSEDLVACVQKHCKMSAKSVEFAKRMKDIAAKIGQKSIRDTPPKLIAELKALLVEIKRHKVNPESIKCTAEKCSKEYAKNAEHMLRRSAEQLSNMVEFAERVMKQRQAASASGKATARRPAARSSSAKGKTRKPAKTAKTAKTRK